MYFSIRLGRRTNLSLIFNFLAARLFWTARLFEFKGHSWPPGYFGRPAIPDFRVESTVIDQGNTFIRVEYNNKST